MNRTLFTALLALALPLASGLEAKTVTDASQQEVTIPDEPKRIVVVDEVDLDALLALGVQPIGTTMGRGQQTPSRYLSEQTEGVEVVGAFYRPDAERLLDVDPDLILAGGVPIPPVMAKLRSIAPTVATYNLGDDWKTAFANIADVVDREQEQVEFMKRYDARVADVKARLEAAGIRSVSVVRWNPKGPAYMLADAFSIGVLKDLGLSQPEYQRQPGMAHSEPLSLEALHLIDADHLFIGTLAPEGEAVEAMNEAMRAPAFAQLKAVENGNVSLVDGSYWTSLGGPLAAMRIIDEVEAALLP